MSLSFLLMIFICVMQMKEVNVKTCLTMNIK